MSAPFKAVLLGCPNGHYEATLEEHSTLTGMTATCALCSQSLALVKTVTIWPGGQTVRLPDDYQIHQAYRVVCSKKTGRHRFHAYNRTTLTDAQTTLDILAQASWTVDCRPFTLEERTVSPWQAA